MSIICQLLQYLKYGDAMMLSWKEHVVDVIKMARSLFLSCILKLITERVLGDLPLAESIEGCCMYVILWKR